MTIQSIIFYALGRFALRKNPGGFTLDIQPILFN